MAETGRTDPFGDFISMAAGPIAAVIRQFDQLRRGAEEMLKGFENFHATMANLNETAGRINRLLNDFEEPIRAMLPQITRTVKMADEMSARLSAPLDQVVPGLSRLANTLDSPVMRSLPTDLGQFLDIINDVARRMSPLAQLAEQASGMFGFRLPGFSSQPSRPTTTTPDPTPPPAATAAKSAPKPPRKRAAAKKRAPAKKAAARKR
jgi:hypothetical protein